MNAYVINDGGFSFGMDSVTPVSWKFSSKKLTRNVYRDWKMPDYMRHWCKANKTWIGSKNELLSICAVEKAKAAS